MLSILSRGIWQMNSKQNLIAALLGIATMIAMPITASAFVGHHYGWRNDASCNHDLICDEDGDDCYSAAWPDEYEDDFEPYAGYENQYYAPSYNDRAYNNYDYNPGYGGEYNAPYDNNGAYGGLSTLAPLLQQFIR